MENVNVDENQKKLRSDKVLYIKNKQDIVE